jgi:ABC-type lipoprotein export system ATPase subunit
MLVCRDLAKNYETGRGTIRAVRGVDLEVPQGRFAAIVGRSGSGKSSLMAMIGGLSRPTSGTVQINETDIWGMSDNALAQFRSCQIGYVFQPASLLPTLRVIDNVALPALLSRAAAIRAIYERAEDLLTWLGLAELREAYPSEISAGQQRRTAIARALINAPSLILADEPTSDLDEPTELEILDELMRMNRDRGTTLLLVTHNLSLAAQAEQILHIANGRLVHARSS